MLEEHSASLAQPTSRHAVVLSRQSVFAGVSRSRWILRKMSSAMRMIDELIVASSIPIVVFERTTHL